MKEKLQHIKWYRSIAFNIVLWFLPIIIIPILIISYDSNKTIIQNIQETSYHDIKQVSTLEARFIKNWFKYREIDIQTWSKAQSSKDLLVELRDDFKNSSKPLNDFVKSDEYKNTSILMEADLYNLLKRYDYVYDLFLIDKKGNILFSVEKASTLGTNLLSGKYSTTKFADAFRKTMKDKKIHFSDLELYKPSSNDVSGFFTAPIINDDGKIIGAFATQIKLDVIYRLFSSNSGLITSFHHYLVGEDGLLRSKISAQDEILKLKISDKQLDILNNHKDYIGNYINPLKNEVFEIHQHINILGVKWILVSEADIKYISEATGKIVDKAVIYIILTLLVVLLISLLVSKKLVKPILNLSELMMKFSAGDRDINIDTSMKNEIGILALTFKDMMNSLRKSENDLTEQKNEAYRALKELEMQKYALDSHAIVAITDVKGDIIFVNDKFVEISGYTKDELIGKNHRLLNSKLHTKEYWADMYRDVSSGKVWHDEVRNIAKDGSFYWLDTTIVPFMDDKGKPKSYIAIRTDVTDRKKAEIKLIEAKELAEESVKAKSSFLASMSHEIRTPMNGVIGMLGLLMNTKLDDGQRHQAYLAQSSATALLALINDILDFSKIEAGKLELEALDFNIRKELGDFAEAIAFRAQEKGVELVLDVAQIDMTFINADSGRIRQILNNIVGNSIKFTSKGHILIKAALYSKIENTARIMISVSDTGIGIPKEKIDTLFDSFSQVDSSTTRKYGGTGLGLSIVKKLCELMNGSVKVSSVLGEGSTFEVDIEVGCSKKSSLVIPPVQIKGKKAIIVDDSEVSTHMLRVQLEHWGMEVYVSRTSKEALEMIDKSFDIAFIDKDIKELNAQELAKALKKERGLENLKLVIMTSVSDRGDINLYIEHGYDAYFPKPTTTSDIFNALNVLAEDATPFKERNIYSEVETQKVYEWAENTKILLVDDNRVNQLVANGLLEELGLEADVANNGQEALEAIEKAGDEPYSIILMDCQMPVMDGYEATQKIKAGVVGESNANIPVIAMTANAMEGDKEKCFASGMDDYISKPINPDILEDKLKKYLLKDV